MKKLRVAIIDMEEVEEIFTHIYCLKSEIYLKLLSSWIKIYKGRK